MLRSVAAAQVHLDDDGARAILRVTGEIDIATTPFVDDAVVTITTPTIVLDLSGVTFMGSSGLASLLRASHRAEELNGSLELRAPSRSVRDLLAMTHLTDRFTITE